MKFCLPDYASELVNVYNYNQLGVSLTDLLMDSLKEVLNINHFGRQWWKVSTSDKWKIKLNFIIRQLKIVIKQNK